MYVNADFSFFSQADLSPASMHSAPLFGGMAGSGFQPGMPSANTAFPIGTSNAFNATNAFPGETYGIPGFSERPKKVLKHTKSFLLGWAVVYPIS